MGNPAARIADVHVYFKALNHTPHVGGKPNVALGLPWQDNGQPDKVAANSPVLIHAGGTAPRAPTLLKSSRHQLDRPHRHADGTREAGALFGSSSDATRQQRLRSRPLRPAPQSSASQARLSQPPGRTLRPFTKPWRHCGVWCSVRQSRSSRG